MIEFPNQWNAKLVGHSWRLPVKYSKAEVEGMKEKVRNLKAMLAETKDANQRQKLENEIRGLEISISGSGN